MGYPFTTQHRANQGHHSYVMGARIKFLVAGTVVALGALNRHNSTMALYEDYNNVAVGGPVVIAGNNSTSTTRNYNYTTLPSPVSVTANSIYRIGLKNSYRGVCLSQNSYIC